MPYFVRKVRNQEKYRVNFKDDKGTSNLYEFDTKEEAYKKMRNEIYKLVEEEKQQDIINDSDSLIEDV
jgi:hypothetical protein